MSRSPKGSPDSSSSTSSRSESATESDRREPSPVEDRKRRKSSEVDVTMPSAEALVPAPTSPGYRPDSVGSPVANGLQPPTQGNSSRTGSKELRTAVNYSYATDSTLADSPMGKEGSRSARRDRKDRKKYPKGGKSKSRMKTSRGSPEDVDRHKKRHRERHHDRRESHERRRERRREERERRREKAGTKALRSSDDRDRDGDTDRDRERKTRREHHVHSRMRTTEVKSEGGLTPPHSSRHHRYPKHRKHPTSRPAYAVPLAQPMGSADLGSQMPSRSLDPSAGPRFLDVAPQPTGEVAPPKYQPEFLRANSEPPTPAPLGFVLSPPINQCKRRHFPASAKEPEYVRNFSAPTYSVSEDGHGNLYSPQLRVIWPNRPSQGLYSIDGRMLQSGVSREKLPASAPQEQRIHYSRPPPSPAFREESDEAGANWYAPVMPAARVRRLLQPTCLYVFFLRPDNITTDKEVDSAPLQLMLAYKTPSKKLLLFELDVVEYTGVTLWQIKTPPDVEIPEQPVFKSKKALVEYYKWYLNLRCRNCKNKVIVSNRFE